MRICFRFCFVAVLANVLFAASAWAGGLWLYEQATPDMAYYYPYIVVMGRVDLKRLYKS